MATRLRLSFLSMFDVDVDGDEQMYFGLARTERADTPCLIALKPRRRLTRDATPDTDFARAHLDDEGNSDVQLPWTTKLGVGHIGRVTRVTQERPST